MRKIVIIMVSLGILLLIAGFFTEFIVSNQQVWATDSSADSKVLRPYSESLDAFNVSNVGSNLQVTVSANSTLNIDVIHDNKVEYKWEDVVFNKNVMLLSNGTWTVKIRNNSTFNCYYNSSIILKQTHFEEKKPYLWLLPPFIFFGALSLSLSVPIHFSNKLRGRLNKKVIKETITFAALLALIFSYQIAGFALHTSAPWNVSQGVSMQPTIYTGDLVIIMGMEPQNILVGDIILFQKITTGFNGEDFSTISVPVLHRCIYMIRVGDHWFFKTKGDNNPEADDWYVPDEGVLGKAVLILPKVGFLFLILERTETKIILLTAILIIFFIWPSIKVKKPQTSGLGQNHLVQYFLK